ncbi:MAG: hypothetical protein A3I03_15150 [Candidatus Rokubacteria bacterium RIFCSPLOWO2_02_FULL_68_19]|nr:MAG: hypothetical protein A3I03_15150 [Candidatus Rokubacteria bacterium RIFCSPLOWO2_02_FULL_68_19]
MAGRSVAALLAALLIAAGAGWAQDVTRYLRLEWEVSQGRRGHAVVSGYLYNDYGLPAVRVQLRVEVLDASGQTVSETTAYIDREVPPLGRAYFEASLPRAGAGYRVTVNYFDWLMIPGSG